MKFVLPSWGFATRTPTIAYLYSIPRFFHRFARKLTKYFGSIFISPLFSITFQILISFNADFGKITLNFRALPNCIISSLPPIIWPSDIWVIPHQPKKSYIPFSRSQINGHPQTQLENKNSIQQNTWALFYFKGKKASVV